MARNYNFGSASKTSVAPVRHMKTLYNRIAKGQYRIVNNPRRTGR